MTGLADCELAAATRAHVAAGRNHLRVIANRYTARLLAAPNASAADWAEVGCGDLADETSAVVVSAAKAGRLHWLNADQDDVAAMALAGQTFAQATTKHVSAWLRERDAVTVGRQGEIDSKVRFEVASLAGWRCQFDGCGQDLRAHFVPGVRGNFGYFAHIVASSPGGPRASEGDCAALANNPTNIMLLCDKCHRLVDREAPHRYNATYLREMRANSVAEVGRLLGNLSFASAQMLVVGGSIEGQVFGFDQRLAEEAMWLRKQRSATPHAEWFARNGAHLGATNSPGYWSSLFATLRDDIPALKRMLTGTRHGGAPRPPLALFPVHGTSTLVLTGRLLGESSSIAQYQFQRDQVDGRRGGQWAWPGVRPPAADKYKWNVLRAPTANDTEALLRVGLTAKLPPNELPAALFSDGQYALPTVEVAVDQPHHTVIGHPDDLALLGRALDHALQTIQDGWRL
ncbi:MAG: SAVED domain-containing protein, partial [Burkholderiales bacterium]|nr:SAVED domain-containing protein [Burkholderiales bacterium]